jgi:hypothetical protein
LYNQFDPQVMAQDIEAIATSENPPDALLVVTIPAFEVD